MKYYIKERHNPQLGVYYVPCGTLSKQAAKRAESSLYGENYMLAYETEAEYQAALATLRNDGEKVQ